MVISTFKERFGDLAGVSVSGFYTDNRQCECKCMGGVILGKCRRLLQQRVPDFLILPALHPEKAKDKTLWEEERCQRKAGSKRGQRRQLHQRATLQLHQPVLVS